MNSLRVRPKTSIPFELPQSNKSCAYFNKCAVLRSPLDKGKLKCLLSTCHVLNPSLAAVQTASQLTFTQPIKVDIIVPAL